MNLIGRRKQFLYFLLLWCIVVIAYHPVLSNGFLDSWDEQWMVMNAHTEGGWTFENLRAIWTQNIRAQYSPLVELHYLFLYTLFGYDPLWFHLASIVWHGGCATLVFFFIRRVLLFSRSCGPRCSWSVAALAAGLFAIHPVNVEAAAWISAVKVPMYTFFYLAALLLYMRYVESRKIVSYIGAMCCLAVSCLSKEQAFVFPLALLLLDWFGRRDLKSIKVWLEKLPFGVVSVGFALLTLALQGEFSNAVSYSLGQRTLFGCYSLFEYITKSLVPVNLSYMYPYPISEEDTDMPSLFYIYPVLVALLLFVVYYYRKRRVFLFGCLFFLIHLLLSLHIVAIPRAWIVADRYLYLSLVSVLLLVSYGCTFFLKKAGRSWIRVLEVLLLLVYGIYLGSYTYQYGKKWKDADTLKVMKVRMKS